MDSVIDLPLYPYVILIILIALWNVERCSALWYTVGNYRRIHSRKFETISCTILCPTMVLDKKIKCIELWCIAMFISGLKSSDVASQTRVGVYLPYISVSVKFRSWNPSNMFNECRAPQTVSC